MKTFKGTVVDAKVSGSHTNFPEVVLLENLPASFWSTVHGTTLEDGLVSYYRLDETSGTTAKDLMRRNNLTANNARVFTSEVDGIVNTGADFTQGSDYISGGQLIPYGSFSLSFWFYSGNVTTNQRFYTERNTGGGNPLIQLYLTGADSKVNFQLRGDDGTGLTSISTAAVSTNTWYHVVATFNLTGKVMNLYLNAGTPVSDTYGGNTWTNNRTAIGIEAEDLSTQPNLGKMDEVAIWNRVLTSSEITGLYNSGSGTQAVLSGGDIRVYSDAALTTQLAREVVSCDTTVETGELHLKHGTLATGNIVYITVDGTSTEPAADSTYGSQNAWNSNYEAVYHMNEASGNITDSTDHSDTGTANGNPTYGVTGALGDAIDFDGTGDYFNGLKDYGTAIGTGDLTVQGFFKVANQNSRRTLISFGESDFSTYFTIRAGRDTDTNDIALISRASSPGQVTISSTGFQDNAYHLFHATRSGTTGTFYLDGTQQNQTTNAEWASSLGNDTTIGSFFSGTDDLDGTLDEIRILSTELSANWITTEYNNQNDPSAFRTWEEFTGFNPAIARRKVLLR